MEALLLHGQDALFNHYVATHPHGDSLQITFWGQLKESSGWNYHPLAVRKGGVLQGAALILTKKLPYLPHTVAYSPRGPLYSSEEALVKLWEAGKELALAKGALVWKMDPPLPHPDPLWEKLTKQNNLQRQDTGLDFLGVQPRFVMTLDLRPSLDTILKNMKSKTRYNIRYAERKEVRVFIAKEKKQLGVFYTLLQETATRDGFTIRPLSYFEAMWDQLVQHKFAQLFLAYHHSTPLAGAILFRLGKRAWYVYGASTNENRNLQAAHLLQWEMIKWAKSQGCQIYDFRGVSGDLNPEHPLYGLYRFKEGFGAQLEEYVGEYDLPISRGGYLLWQRGLMAHHWLGKRNIKT